MVERCFRNAEAGGSIPPDSTSLAPSPAVRGAHEDEVPTREAREEPRRHRKSAGPSPVSSMGERPPVEREAAGSIPVRGAHGEVAELARQRVANP